MVAIAIVEVFGIREQVLDIALTAALEPAHHSHHAVRISDRERFQRHGIEGGEERGVDADAEREREDRDQRVPGALPKYARGVAEIFPDAIEERESAMLAMIFLKLRQSA